MYPKLTINLHKLLENTLKMKELCHENGIINFCVVVKVLAGDYESVKSIADLGIDYLGDSRIENLKKYQLSLQKKR